MANFKRVQNLVFQNSKWKQIFELNSKDNKKIITILLLENFVNE